MSALAGAGTYVVPNALFALQLQVNVLRFGRATPTTFFIGEACKLFATVLLLGLLAHSMQQSLVWPALLFGLAFALKGYLLLPMFRKLS
jgi:ATP synthase protein I